MWLSLWSFKFEFNSELNFWILESRSIPSKLLSPQEVEGVERKSRRAECRKWSSRSQASPRPAPSCRKSPGWWASSTPLTTALLSYFHSSSFDLSLMFLTPLNILGVLDGLTLECLKAWMLNAWMLVLPQILQSSVSLTHYITYERYLLYKYGVAWPGFCLKYIKVLLSGYFFCIFYSYHRQQPQHPFAYTRCCQNPASGLKCINVPSAPIASPFSALSPESTGSIV